MQLRRPRIALVSLAACLVLLAVILAAQIAQRGPGVASDNVAAAASIGGPFRLVTQEGTYLSNDDLKGAPFAVFFGFTHCPEICPMTLSEMPVALKELGKEGERFRVLFISVDPTRDTPEFLARYLQSFDRRIIGLSGSEADVASVGKAYRAYWEKVPTSESDYTMNHTASVFLMDAKGEFFGTIAYGEDHESRVAKLKRLLG